MSQSTTQRGWGWVRSIASAGGVVSAVYSWPHHISREHTKPLSNELKEGLHQQKQTVPRDSIHCRASRWGLPLRNPIKVSYAFRRCASANRANRAHKRRVQLNEGWKLPLNS